VVSEYIKQESQQKTPDVFLETHLPITKIHAEQLYGSDNAGGFVDERQLFEHITQSDAKSDENRIYMLKGEVGSGKSHLCQWLEYQINGQGDLDGAEEHVAIHISRNNTRLSDILEKLYEHIGIEHDELSDIGQLDPDDLADFIITGLRTFGANTERFSDFELEEFIRDQKRKLDLRAVLTENIEEYQETLAQEERGQRIDLISREEFGQLCFDAFGSTLKDSDVYPVVRNAIHDRLMKNLGIEDFQSELVRVANQYQKEDKRPVLIAEDVTTFTVLKDDLLDYIFQLGDGADEMQSGFDVILGYTTGWETEQADDALIAGDLSFMTQRAVGYLSLTDEDGEAYFLEDGPMPVRLVGKYLSVIKEQSGTTANGDIPEEDFDERYPFNDRAIVRAYRNLQEQGNRQQTPRLLLYHVVGDCLVSDVPPHEKLGENTYIADFHDPTSADFTPAVNRLLKWYGKLDGGSVVVPAACFETFDVEVPPDVRVEDGMVAVEKKFMSSDWEVSEELLEGEVTAGRSDEGETGDSHKKEGSTTDTGADDDDSGTTQTGDDGTGPGGPDGPGTGKAEEGPEYPEATEALAHFQDWYGTGNEFPSAERLTEGVQTALNMFYDPTRLANANATTKKTAGFYYASGNDVPVEIRGADASKDVAVTVSPFDDGNPDYERMLYYMTLYPLEGPEQEADEFHEDLNMDAVRGWCDTQVQELREQMREDLEDVLGDELTLERFIVLANSLLLNAVHGTTELDRGLLVRDPDDFGVDKSSPFKRTASNEFRENPVELPSGLRTAYGELADRKTEIMRLSQGFFLLKGEFVDHERLDSAQTYVEENYEDCLAAAARIRADDVADGYRVGTTRNNAKTRVSALFEAVSNYANELEKFERSFDTAEFAEETETVRQLHDSHHTADELLEAYDRLVDSLDPLDVTLRERWEEAKQVLDEQPDELDLRAFGSTLEELTDADPDSPVEAIALLHTYNESKDTQQAWLVYEVLEELLSLIEDEPQPDVTQFVEQVRDSREFQQFQKQRDGVVETIGGI
jgi:hypothetical protein